MATAAIDTLRYAERVKESGVEHSTANEMARALNDELADHVPTKVDLEPRFESLETKVESLDTKFEARCDALEAKFDARCDALEAKFDARCDALEAKFDARCDAMEAKFEARINALDAKLEAKFDSLAASLKTTNAMMLFGFALLGTLGFFQLAKDPSPPPAPVAIERPAVPNAPPVESTP